ncbi:hypothetical protein V8C35DRAFT_305180 [Trichoderma chlorosporum]
MLPGCQLPPIAGTANSKANRLGLLGSRYRNHSRRGRCRALKHAPNKFQACVLALESGTPSVERAALMSAENRDLRRAARASKHSPLLQALLVWAPACLVPLPIPAVRVLYVLAKPVRLLVRRRAFAWTAGRGNFLSFCFCRPHSAHYCRTQPVVHKRINRLARPKFRILSLPAPDAPWQVGGCFP